MSQLSGIEKASLLLIALGSKTASSVLQQLSPEEVHKLAAQMSKQETVAPNVREQVLSEYTQSRGQGQMSGGLEYVQELLDQALGPDKAKEVLAEIASGSSGRPFDWLRSLGADRVADFLHSERPQVIALVLAHLPTELAADMMSRLPEDLQGKVAYRLTSIRPVASEIVRAIEDTAKSRLSKEGAGSLRTVGGVQALVTILNNADRSMEKKILEYLEGTEPRIAESMKQLMFVFEDVTTLDDRAIQAVIRDSEQEDLRLSLKGASDVVKEAFLKNMSERAAEAMKEDLEMLGSVRVRDVEAAQRRMVAVIRKLEDTGEISLRQDGEEVIT